MKGTLSFKSLPSTRHSDSTSKTGMSEQDRNCVEKKISQVENRVTPDSSISCRETGFLMPHEHQGNLFLLTIIVNCENSIFPIKFVLHEIRS